MAPATIYDLVISRIDLLIRNVILNRIVTELCFNLCNNYWIDFILLIDNYWKNSI